jgi:glycine/D-amino acid oxidase-like deaminating enzyme
MDLHTGTPYWPIRDGRLAAYPRLAQDLTVEVAIIGGGITGALAAYELTSAGAEVALFERREIATGSSAATTGLLMCETDTSLDELARHFGADRAARAYEAGLEAIDRIEDLCVTLGDQCGFARRPSMYLASSWRHVGRLKREFGAQRACGFDGEWLSRKDIRRHYSFSAPAAIRGHAAEVDCYRLTKRLIADAHARGARIYEHSAVTRLQTTPGGVEIHVNGAHAVRALRAVCASGYELAEELDRPAGRLTSTWVLVTEPLDDFAGWSDRCVIWDTNRPYFYVRSTDDGRLMAGGEDEPWAETHRSRLRFPAKTERLLKRARRWVPQLDLKPAYAWAGTFATTDDGLPFIGTLNEHPNLWFSLGYGGNGITFSVVAATLLRDHYLGRHNPDAELFGFNRRKV